MIAVSTSGRRPAAGGRGPAPAATSVVAGAAACLITLALLAIGAFTGASLRPGLSRAHGRAVTARLPIDLLPSASAAIGAAERRFWATRDGASARAHGGGIASSFTASGAALHADHGTLDLALAGIGRGARLTPLGQAAPSVARNEVIYRRGALEELYRNGPAGIEQGFTLRERQRGAGPLVLALRSTGSLAPQQRGGQVVFRDQTGAAVLRYGRLGATDASGRALAAQIALRGRTIELRIDDRLARYPLTIDPFVQQGGKLTPAEGEESATGELGTSVAVSADGNTALLGARYDKPAGAAWVFTRSGIKWSEQAKLLGGSEGSGFGAAVALSSDGNTALIGGPTDIGNKGAAWVFTRSEAGKWSQQAKLTASKEESGSGELGWSVALSETGDTALIGGEGETVEPWGSAAGAAWVFTRSAGMWSLQRKLTGSGEKGKARFGYSVALSGDGTAALVGGPCDEAGNKTAPLLPCEPTKGAAWSFIFEGGEWKLQGGAKFLPAGETEALFGSSVALSGNGRTALIGGESEAAAAGAAWAFTRSEPKEAKWTQQAKLTGAGEVEHAQFGHSVALSADGKTALVGGPFDNKNDGAAWAFTVNGTEWKPEGKLTGGGASEERLFGAGVALSSDGATAVIGGPFDATEAGAAWVFVNKMPAVSSVTPPGGPKQGKTKVTILGSNFNEVESVTFGAVPALNFTRVSETEMTAESPPGTGTVDVVVTAAKHESQKSTSDRFTYDVPVVAHVAPNAGPLAGKTTVTLTGANFSGATAVKFGTTTATKFEVNSATSITAEAPAESAATVHVRVTTSLGTSDAGENEEADLFTYTPKPVVTKVEPNLGAEGGGASVTITGTNLGPATAVAFGATPASSFKVESQTSISATSPAGAGTADVTVTSPGGTSATGEADQFTYLPPPKVTKVEPNKGPEGGGPSVTITGEHLLHATAVKFGTRSSFVFKAESETTATAIIPGGSGTVDVTVTTPGGTSAPSEADRFTYVPAPTVAKLEPTRGPEGGGTTVTVTGSNFGEVSAVKFNATAAKGFKVNSPTSITAESPAGVGTADVTVTTPGGTSSTGANDRFTYVAAPVVSEVKPSKGAEGGGTAVTLTGSNFIPEGIVVKFGATAAKGVKVNSPTEITAESPAGVGTVDVTVATDGGTSKAVETDHFTYLPPPTITKIEPAQGPEAGGTTLTITGTNLKFATAVKFGSASVEPKNVSENSLTAVSPAGTSTVDVSVTTPGGTSAAVEQDRFTYVPVPAVSGVSPNEGLKKGGSSVTITGAQLSGATAVKFGASAAASYKVESKTTITATAPEGEGTVDVTVTTAGGTSATSEADAFKYLPPPEATTGEAVAAQTTATLNASVNPQGGKVGEVGVCKFEYGVTISEHSKPCSPTPGPETKSVAVSAAVEGLAPSTEYHFRIVVKTAGGEAAGATLAFKTAAPTAPIVESLTASPVAQTAATLTATVNAHGSEVEQCEFEYGQPPGFGSSAECSPKKPGKESTPVPVSAAITGLSPNTVYHFRVTTKNSSGKGNVVEQTFRTLPSPPTVVTGEASATAQTTATLTATVNPNGGEVGECKLEYGTSTAYGSSAPCVPTPGSGTSPVAVSASIGGLAPNTTYHFRISAGNAGGTSTGADRSFAILQSGGAPGSGAGGPGAGGGLLPTVTLLGTSLIARSSGILTVTLLCPVGESSCIGKITLRVGSDSKTRAKKRAGRALTLTHGSFTLAGGQRKAFKLRLTAAARALLAVARKLRAQATITAHDAAGASASTLASVTLRFKH